MLWKIHSNSIRLSRYLAVRRSVRNITAADVTHMGRRLAFFFWLRYGKMFDYPSNITSTHVLHLWQLRLKSNKPVVGCSVLKILILRIVAMYLHASSIGLRIILKLNAKIIPRRAAAGNRFSKKQKWKHVQFILQKIRRWEPLVAWNSRDTDGRAYVIFIGIPSRKILRKNTGRTGREKKQIVSTVDA